MSKIILNKLGFYQISPSPSYEEVDKFYRKDFYAEDYKYFNDSSLENQNKDKEFNELNWENEHKIVKSILKKEIMSILDIGCGWCKYLEWCKKKGKEVFGLDPSPESSDYGKSLGLNIINSNFETLTDLGRTFDLVVLKNVLEHVIEPINFLKQISDKYMHKGSILQIEVPNEFNNFQIAAQKTHNLNEWWVAPPAHLNYFSVKSLKKTGKSVDLIPRDIRASFPMELFLLMGHDYVRNSSLGNECHKMRVLFEQNLIKSGHVETMDLFYKKLAEAGLGRQIVIFFQK